MADNKHIVSHNDYVDQPRGGKVKRHCKKFWWVWLVMITSVVLLVVLLIIFVGVAKIAQAKVNESKLKVQSIRVLQTQPDQYNMDIDSTITTDGKVHAKIDAFTGQMYLEDVKPHRPFAYVDFPETDSSAFQVVNVSQHTLISDLDAFTQFNSWLLRNESLRVTVTGNTHVHVRGLSKAYGVTFKKTVTLPGLRNFEGTTVSNPNVSIAADDRGDNFHGTTTIPNHSIVTFEIGNASFHNYLFGAEIGTVYIDNMTLYPGLNNFSMRANISQPPVLTALGEKPYCQDDAGTLPFQLRGKNVINHGGRLAYFADALAAGNQTVNIALSHAINATVGFVPPCKGAKSSSSKKSS